MSKPVLGNDPFTTAASPTAKPAKRSAPAPTNTGKKKTAKAPAKKKDEAKKPAAALKDDPKKAPKAKPAKAAKSPAKPEPPKPRKPPAPGSRPKAESAKAAEPPRSNSPPPAPSQAPASPDAPPKDLPDIPQIAEAVAEEGIAISPRIIGGEDVALLRHLRPDFFDVGQEFGLDPAFRESLKPLLTFLYRHYWRVTVKGLDNLPPQGRAVLVANHAGILPFDALMLNFAVRRESGRELWPLIEDLFYHAPVLGPLLSRAGCVRACQENAQRLLAEDQLVAVFPEGVKGVVKPYRQRYRLQRFGRGGFVKLCLQTDSPAIPVAIVGSEEAHPLLANLESLAKFFGLPYFPLTPLFPWLGPLGLAPLPSKWTILIGEPIYINQFGPEAAGDRVAVNRLSNQLKNHIQKMIDMEIGSRRSRWH